MNNPSIESNSSSARDTFLYLLGLVTLVISTVSFGMLIYQYIDLKFPDILQYRYSSANYELIRTALASLVVVFPVFFWVSRVLHLDVVAHPEKRNISIRRWLLYFTVFVSSLVLIGDLITLIRSFLNGELTISFVLKVITIFFIAGATLFYYLSELRDKNYPRKAFQAVIVAVVLLAVVCGFYVAGSPQNQRLVRFDDQKSSDLQNIQSRLVYYWQQKGSLPTNLEVLNDPISGYTSPQDSQTGEAYEYNLTGSKAFQLCAVFNRASVAQLGDSSPFGDTWQHDAGRVCFDRTIDPLLYPVNPKNPIQVK